MVDWDAILIGPVDGIFGEPATYFPATGGSWAITGIFDEAYVEVALAGGMGVTSARPVIGVQLSQFLFYIPQQGDTLTIARTGETFIVKEVRDDGHGAAQLLLNLDS
jgi:hypothetical protein